MTAALELPSLLREPNLLDEKQDWTVDDLASLPEDLRYELIDGRLILPSPTGFHQNLCRAIAVMLEPNCPPAYAPTTDVSLKVNSRNEPRPDVVVHRKAVLMRTPAPLDGALLLIEVVSPTSHARDTYAKAKLFAEVGVEHYWVVDPTFDGGVMLTDFRIGSDGTYDIAASTNKVYTTDQPYPITIDVPALTALRDEYRQAAAEE
jgi:Uma2 family endonuclease